MTTAIAVPALAPAPRPAPGVWWARITRRGIAPVEHSLVAARSDRFPAGTPVDLSALNARGRRPAGWVVDVRYGAVDGAVVRVDVAPDLCDLPLWFTELHHSGAAVPAVTLTAHVGGPVRPGSLVPPRTAGTPVGRFRWQLRSGLAETLTMPAPDERVRRVLPAVAGALAALRGWPALRGDAEAREPAAPRGVERLVGSLPARLL